MITPESNLDLQKLAGIRATVMGLGTFGGGAGAVEFLCRQGAHVTVTDLRAAGSLAGQLERLDRLPGHPITWRLGEHRDEDFSGADLVVVNPAVPTGSRWTAIAEAAGAKLTTEIGLFWDLCPARTIAVTGSNGKSTTTAMIHAILSASGQVAWLGGNIGGSLLGELRSISPDDWGVLELSSFQLEHIQEFSPYISCILNLSEDHLDRYDNKAEYFKAKMNIYKNLNKKAYFLYNQKNKDIFNLNKINANKISFGINTMLLFSLVLIIGSQLLLFGIFFLS